MNSFDLMIERYKKELVDAKRKSISDAINEIDDVVTVAENAEASEETQSVILPTRQGDSDDFTNQEVQTVVDLTQTENEPSNASDDNSELNGQPQMENIHSTRPGDSNLEQGLIDKAIRESVMDPTGSKHPIESFGSLRVQVFAADQVYPIAAAFVSVNEGGSNKNYFRGYTDTSGIVDNIVLPSPNPNASQLPSNIIPYAQYDVFVEHPRFIKNTFLGVPVFPNIKSIQAVQLVPSDSESNDETIVEENEPTEPSLTEVENG